MIACLERIAGTRQLGSVEIRPDPLAQAVCDTWPHGTDHGRATALGLEGDGDLDTIVREYLEDYG